MEDFYKMTSSFDLLERSESGNEFFKVIREVVAIEDIRLVYILQYKGSQHQSVSLLRSVLVSAGKGQRFTEPDRT
ncbi:hypothetical protein N7450_007461 [Penicillium hetheringtonii]|uniref:Uncharacterized protein n=1 Tax=Penicillium hetheringtonii TaxID=911720 RepID=A0AAD6DHK2_9EURO|nr:hypothetical protein N7450_007461 [Penicillium hetheringtonii]